MKTNSWESLKQKERRNLCLLQCAMCNAMCKVGYVKKKCFDLKKTNGFSFALAPLNITLHKMALTF